MSRATRWISRGPESRADSTMAPMAARTSATADSFLANEHPRRVHHRESRHQAEHHRGGRKSHARREEAAAGAGRRGPDLPREPVDDLRDRAGAEAEAQDGNHLRVDEPAEPRAGNRRHAADQAE